MRYFNEYLNLYPELFDDMLMWHYRKDVRSPDAAPGPIPADLVAEGVFAFLGKRQPMARPDYERMLDDLDRLVPLYRYVESGGTSEPVATIDEGGFKFRPGRTDRKASAVVSVLPRELNVSLRHNAIQKELYRQLVAEVGAERVACEQPSGVGTFVDAVVQAASGAFWFYEIKTDHSPRACIREAVGQLLEYANWPGSPKVERLVVVGEQPLDADGGEYLRRLEERFALPLHYQQVAMTAEGGAR